MAFRADEAELTGFENAKRKLVLSPSLDSAQRKLALETLEDLVRKHGPVVTAYPTWHPLVPQVSSGSTITLPSSQCGYEGLDHTIYFAQAFVSCPYGDGSAIIKSVEKMKVHACASISAERLNVKLYNSAATPILVRCKWHNTFPKDHMVPKNLAVPLMIEREMRRWQGSEFGETWETMSPYLLGAPHGARSSLFVTQDTAMAMKRAYMSMVESGMFGPLHTD